VLMLRIIEQRLSKRASVLAGLSVAVDGGPAHGDQGRDGYLEAIQ